MVRHHGEDDMNLDINKINKMWKSLIYKDDETWVKALQIWYDKQGTWLSKYKNINDLLL